MEGKEAKAKLTTAKEKFGREIRVFETALPSSSHNVEFNTEETDDLYEFTAKDYYRIMNTKKEGCDRVWFPDNITLEATFRPSETIQSLVDLLMRVIAQPELSFHMYTTPKKLIEDMTQDFYSAGFAPGAVVYFSYDIRKGDNIADVSSL